MLSEYGEFVIALPLAFEKMDDGLISKNTHKLRCTMTMR